MFLRIVPDTNLFKPIKINNLPNLIINYNSLWNNLQPLKNVSLDGKISILLTEYHLIKHDFYIGVSAYIDLNNNSYLKLRIVDKGFYDTVDIYDMDCFIGIKTDEQSICNVVEHILDLPNLIDIFKKCDIQ